MLLSSGTVHPSIRAQHYLYSLLKGIPQISIDRRFSLEAMKNLNRNYDALFLYIHRQRISQLSFKTFEDYVYKGGSFFALHSASASFKKVPRYFEILGGRFLRHDRVMQYEVKSPVPTQPSPTTSNPDFSDITPFMVFDELYIHEYSNVDVRLVTVNNEPVLWTKLFGKGKVCYLSLGHTAQTLKEEPVKEIIHRSLQWLLEGKKV